MNHLKPIHPGKFIQEIYMVPFKLSIQKMAEMLCLSPLTFTRLLDGESKITPELAHRLAKSLGRTAESWLSLQAQYDAWCEKEKANLKVSRKLSLHDN